MTGGSPSQTNPTLLARLRQDPTDQEAWQVFVERYGPKIYGWCRRWNLQDADAQDVTQLVLVRLASAMRTFVYDPGRSFRAWLRTLAQHAWSDLFAQRARLTVAEDSLKVLDGLGARQDLVERLNELYDQEVLEEATFRVRLQVRPEHWEVFRLLAVEGHSGSEVAAQFGYKVATAFAIRSKVQKLLREAVQKLEGTGSPS